MQFVPECYKGQEMCDKVFNKCFLVFIYISDQYKTQETCDSFISEDCFAIRYALDQYKTQQMCDEAVGFLIGLLQLKWLRNFLHTVLHADDDKTILMKILVMSYFLVMKWIFLM